MRHSEHKRVCNVHHTHTLTEQLVFSTVCDVRVSITLLFQPDKKCHSHFQIQGLSLRFFCPISSDMVSRTQWAYCIYKHTHTQAMHFSGSKNMLFVYGLEIEIDRWAFKARKTLIWDQIRLHFSGWWQLKSVEQWETQTVNILSDTPNRNFLNAVLHWQFCTGSTYFK